MNTPQKSQTARTVLLAVLAFLGGAAAIRFLHRRRQKALEADMAQMQREQDALREENIALQAQLLAPPSPAPPAADRKPRSWLDPLLLVLILLLAAVGPVLVMLERWFLLPEFRDILRVQWCRSEFLCKTVLPSYFVVIIPCFLLALVLLFWLNQRLAIPFLAEISPKKERPKTDLPVWQLQASRMLEVAAVFAAAVMFLLAVLQGRNPGDEFPFIVLFYLLSVLLKAVDFRAIRSFPQRLPKWLAPFLFNHISLILFMRSLNGHAEALLSSGLLLAISLGLLFPYRRQIPAVLWVVNLAVILYTLLLQSWRFGIIGDEYIFYHYGRIMLNEHSLKHVLDHLLSARTVIYGKFLYLSVLPHAISMRLLGDDNFGWRFANIYLAILAIPFFYAFIKSFWNRRTALIYAFLFAVSQYLIVFARIGYNNVQSLLGMAVVLWLAGKAVTTGKDLYYSLLGIGLGLCLYIYPAVLGVMPLPILLLLIYQPPWRSRRAFAQWMLMVAGFSLLFLPLIFEPDYWQQKMSESAMEAVGVSQYFHVFSNLLYSLFSFLYNPEETHYVVSSYLAPVSGMLVTLGLGWALWRARREKFMRFVLGGLVFLFFSLGASRSRALPSATHMFLILPWWFLFTTLGIEWLLQWIHPRRSKKFVMRAILVILLIIIAMNMVHAFTISPMRSERYHSLEALHMRFVQDQSGRDDLGNQGKFLFITDEKWNIYGFNSFRDAYHLPPAQAQLVRVPLYDRPFYPLEERIVLPIPPIVDEEEGITHLELETWAFELAMQPDTVVIVQPWLTEYELQAIALLMTETGKQPCPIKPTPLKEASFTMWLDESRIDACPHDGSWPGFW
jgi:dolichyl-phosphate-mannose-protein mannosyltransferase